MKQRTGFWPGVAVMALCICAAASASTIERMDVYDKADNHLLFVTFDYNNAGQCIGRNVFASDSTFLRSVTIQPGGSTAATKELSADFNGDPLFTTIINPPSGGKSSFSTVDQFGLSQFGPPLSYTETASNKFDVVQNNVTLCKEQYEFDGNGDLTRIAVLDKNGAEAWYAKITHLTAAVRPVSPALTVHPVRLTVDRGRIHLRFELSTAGFVCAELFSPAGRKVLSIVNGPMPAGNHRFSADASLLGNGTYVMKMTTNTITSLTRMIAVQK